MSGSLASARTRTIAVLVPTIANAIFADTVQGLSDEVEPRGYTVIQAGNVAGALPSSTQETSASNWP